MFNAKPRFRIKMGKSLLIKASGESRATCRGLAAWHSNRSSMGTGGVADVHDDEGCGERNENSSSKDVPCEDRKRMSHYARP